MRVIGTAGHVDHGKSALVEALTGIHPDRLKEEKAREMTIELGFGWLTLPNGEEVGIVDVPGHRDFIENMLAGVAGIDAALLSTDGHGVQGFGPAGDALVGRVGAVAALMARGCTPEDLSVLEYPYSPPYSSAMDIVNTVGAVAENMLAGMNRGVSAAEFSRMFAEDGAKAFFLDCREPDNAGPYCDCHPGVWRNIPQGRLRERLEDIPRDRAVVLVCNTGIRSYEAQITLQEAGFTDVLNLHGGMAALKMSGRDPKK